MGVLLTDADYLNSSNRRQSKTRLRLQTRQGREFLLRPVRPRDSSHLTDLLSRLSRRSILLRFLLPMPQLSPEMTQQQVQRWLPGQPSVAAVLVATVRENCQESVIAVAELVRDSTTPNEAEIALLVRDDYQREGIGTTLFRQLIQVARRRNIRVIKADILSENVAIQRLIRKLEVPYTSQTQLGQTTLQIKIA